MDVLTYTVSNDVVLGSDGSLTITIRGATATPTRTVTQLAPVVVSEVYDLYLNNPVPLEGEPSLLMNDSDPDGRGLVVSAAGGVMIPSGGGSTLVRVAGTYGSFFVAEDGTWRYEVDSTNTDVLTLKAGSTLMDVLTYTVSNDVVLGSDGSLTITIHGATATPTRTVTQLAPVVVSEVYDLYLNNPVPLEGEPSLLMNDSDPDGPC